MATKIKSKQLAFTYSDKSEKLPIPFAVKAGRFMFSVLDRVSYRLTLKLATHLFFRPRRPGFKPYDYEKIAESTRTELNIRDKKIMISSWGNSDKKILAMHGWEGKGTSFKHLVNPLVENGFQLIAIDAPAHGHSTGNDTDVPEVSNVINEVIEMFGPFYGLIAHSFGSLTSLNALKKSANIEKLILISALASPYTAVKGFGKIFNLPDKILNGIVDNIEKRVNKPFKDFLLDDLSFIEEIDTFLIHDEYDLIVPVKESIKLKGKLPKAELLITQGLGHHKILSNFEIVEKVNDFLST